MPIEIGEVNVQAQVDAPAGDAAPAAPVEPGAEALQRWQALARRDQQRAERLSAWRFDD